LHICISRTLVGGPGIEPEAMWPCRDRRVARPALERAKRRPFLGRRLLRAAQGLGLDAAPARG
jgi:hypothetical protein